MKKNILVIGSGAREHAIVWKLSQSPQVGKIWAAPGNPGMALESKTQNIAIQATDIPALINFAKDNAIDLTIIGAELPLSLGIVDQFQAENLACLGPTKAAAELETSKAFAKDFMLRHNIPTAKYAEFTDIDAAYDYLHNLNKSFFPQVIKADGLAAGKGVIIANNLEEAKNAVNQLLENSTNNNSSSVPIKLRRGVPLWAPANGQTQEPVPTKNNKKIIIEEFLEGFEVSYIILSDGSINKKNIISLATAQDNKRRNNNHQGPNTGGMGACSPAPHMNEALEQRILETIIYPTLENMTKEGHAFQGFLFAGLMITPSGEPKVLEFNCRLGDPETQAILIRLKSDFYELCFNATQGLLDKTDVVWDTRPALSLVIATSQYPEKSVNGEIITGIPEPQNLPENIHIFHAGTAIQNNHLIARGGRILSISMIDESFESIRDNVYPIAKKIHWESGTHFRDDIGVFV